MILSDTFAIGLPGSGGLPKLKIMLDHAGIGCSMNELVMFDTRTSALYGDWFIVSSTRIGGSEWCDGCQLITLSILSGEPGGDFAVSIVCSQEEAFAKISKACRTKRRKGNKK